MAVIFLNDQAGTNLVNYISDELDAIALLPEEERRYDHLYDAVSAYMSGNPNASKEQKYWFQGAAEVNGNRHTLASEFIREFIHESYVQMGHDLTEMQIQQISSNIALAALNDIISNNYIPEMQTQFINGSEVRGLIENDIQGAIIFNGIQVPLAGWGGLAFAELIGAEVQKQQALQSVEDYRLYNQSYKKAFVKAVERLGDLDSLGDLSSDPIVVEAVRNSVPVAESLVEAVQIQKYLIEYDLATAAREQVNDLIDASSAALIEALQAIDDATGGTATDLLDALESFLNTFYDIAASTVDLFSALTSDYEDVPSSILNFLRLFGAEYPVDTPEWALNLESIFGRAMTDPIVLDLDGDGIHLTDIDSSSAYFDLHNTGFAVQTGWISSGDGFLARDLNNNSVIDNITELFGNSTVDGFSALSELDTNNDGKISASDNEWASLKIWKDANGNGQTESGELYTLSNLNIAEISLAAAPHDVISNGNVIADVATFKYGNGTTGMVGEVYFKNSQMNGNYSGQYTLALEVLTLPMVRGYGLLPDLHISMSQDAELLDLVKQFSSFTLSDFSSYWSSVEEILYKWSGVESLQEDGRGPYVNAKHLSIVEKVLGQEFIDFRGNNTSSSNPQSLDAGSRIEAMFQQVVSEVATRLLIQGPLKSFFPAVEYNYRTDGFDGTADMSALFQTLGELDVNSSAGQRELWGDFLPTIISIADNLGLVPSVYEQSLRDALEASAPEGALAALLNNGIIIGDNDLNTYSLNSGAHYVIAGLDDDLIQGGSGNDVVLGGHGNDRIKGGSGTNILDGGKGDDDITVQGFSDQAYGGSGDDMVTIASGSSGVITIDGGDGFDKLIAGANISSWLVTNFEHLHYTQNVTLTPDQLQQFVTISRDSNPNYYIYSAVAGTYDYSSIYAEQTLKLYGSTGDDIIIGGIGTIAINGGAGNDTLSAGSATAGIEFYTGAGANLVNASASNDTIYVQGTADNIQANSGDDTVLVQSTNFGAANLDGGDGFDVLRVGTNMSAANISGFEKLSLTWGVTLTAAQLAGFSTIELENPNHSSYRIYAASAGTYDLSDKTLLTVTRITGSASDDTIIGGTTTNNIEGGAGNDILSAGTALSGVEFFTGTGTNTVNGGNWNDSITVQGLADTVAAGSGDDTVRVTSSSLGAANLDGGDGVDVLRVGTNMSAANISGFEKLSLTWGVTLTAAQLAGFSTIELENPNHSSYRIYAASAGTYDLSDKTLLTATRITGSAGDDTIVGGATTDSIVGGNGNDILNYGSSIVATMFDGGSGVDMISYSQAISAVHINLSASSQELGGVSVAANKAINPNGSISNLISIENATGSAHDDYLWGSSSANVLIGGAGSDILIGDAGNDSLDGGDGVDTVDYSGSTSAVYVNLSAETRTLGTEAVAAGTALDGLGGIDSLSGIENIIGSAYNDYIYGSVYGNTLIGGDGNDRLEGYDAPDVLWGGAGADNLIGGNGADTITYADSPGSVYVNMRGTTNFVYDRDVAGLKAIDGFGFTDTLNGVQNVSGSLTTNTHVYANTEANVIMTFAGNDWVFGDAGDDQISTGSGADILIGGIGNDVLAGGDGIDTVDYSGSTSAVYVNLSAETRTLGTETVAAGTALDGLGGVDSLSGIENIIGSVYNDYIYGSVYGNTLIGGDGNDRLEGYDAPDVLWGGAGADNLIGGNGADTITYADSPGSVYVNMRGTTNFVYDRDVAGLKAIDGFGFTDTLNGVQNVSGSLTTNTHVYANTEANVITTFAGNDWVFGDAGDDQISTGSGADILIGGIGNDVLAGGAGADLFIYNFGDGSDTVTDFNVMEDVIRLAGTGSSFSTLEYFDTANGVELSYNGQKYMLLAGVFESGLAEANFQFV